VTWIVWQSTARLLLLRSVKHKTCTSGIEPAPFSLSLSHNKRPIGAVSDPKVVHVSDDVQEVSRLGATFVHIYTRIRHQASGIGVRDQDQDQDQTRVCPLREETGLLACSPAPCLLMYTSEQSGVLLGAWEYPSLPGSTSESIFGAAYGVHECIT
jgi:hypothetical protein